MRSIQCGAFHPVLPAKSLVIAQQAVGSQRSFQREEQDAGRTARGARPASALPYFLSFK
ncbi:hypothetical protein RHECNPAF_890023 [Rhizobium etli CNPAF512]|nr:hypothetical protein RHECNPAF_890023 [Rhizobium etli CNPAF512]